MIESVRGDSADLVTLTVIIDGKEIPDIYDLSELHVEREINRIPFANITVADGSAIDEDFAASASRTFEPGGKIEIKLGYHAKNKTVFEGIILSQNICLGAGGRSYLVVGCHDAAIKTTLRRSSSGFQDKTDSDAIKALLGNSGLEANVEKTKTKLDYQIKSFSTDWDFILSRAEANGQVVLVENGKVKVARPEFSTPQLVAQFGDTISQLDLELDATHQFTDVRASAWDPVRQKMVWGASSEPVVNKQGDINGSKLASVLGVPTVELQTPSNASEAELKDWADAQLLKSRLARIKGSVEFTGNADIKPGDLLDLEGLGKRFNGSGYVAAVRHKVEEGNWVTRVQLGLSDRWFADVHRDVTAPHAGGLRPGTGGLHIGKVLQIHDDPNSIKSIVTREQLKIRFDDEGKNITVETPGGHIVRLSDEHRSIELTDSNNNRVTMKESGIAIDSPKDITISASGSVSITGQSGVKVESPADVSVAGANVSIEAQASLTAKGGATAELSASGQTTVNGAMVMIN